MNTQSKFVLYLILTASTTTYAVEQQIGAHLNVSTTLSVTTLTNINFGIFQFTSNSVGGTVNLSTSNMLSGVPQAGYISSGVTSVGSINISANSGEEVMINCANQGTMTSATNMNHVLNMASVEYHKQGAMNSPGNCMLPAAYTFTSTGIDTVLIGGSLQMPSGASMNSGSYSTSNQGGNPITLTVSYL